MEMMKIQVGETEYEVHPDAADEIRRQKSKEILHNEKVKVRDILGQTLVNPDHNYNTMKLDQIVQASNEHVMGTVKGLQEQIEAMQGESTQAKAIKKSSVEMEKYVQDLQAKHAEEMSLLQGQFKAKELNSSIMSAAGALNLKSQYTGVFKEIFNGEFETVMDENQTIFRNKLTGNLFYVDGKPGTLSQAVDSIKPKYTDMFQMSKPSNGLSKTPSGIKPDVQSHDDVVSGMFAELGIN